MRHGIYTHEDAQLAMDEIRNALAQLRFEALSLKRIAGTTDSDTFQNAAQELIDGLENAISNSCLETFAADCRQALQDWDGESDFAALFDNTCHLKAATSPYLNQRCRKLEEVEGRRNE